MRFLVTGAAGFIGSNYVHHVLESTTNVSVVSLDSLTYAGDKTNLDGVLGESRHEFVEASIQNEALVTELISDADTIVHFAAESHVDRSIDAAKTFVATNIDGTRVLLEAARGADLEQFIHMSTDEVYGEIYEGKFSESDPLQPRNPYAATKAGADHLVRSYQVTHDIPALIVRSSNNYGPRQHPEKMIPKFITNAAAGDDIPLYGDGSNVREWTYVTDTCRAIEILRQRGSVGEIYNVGSGDERTNLDVTKEIIDAVDASEEQISFVEDRPGHDARYALDTSKIESLGWRPETSFIDGLEKTIEYYL